MKKVLFCLTICFAFCLLVSCSLSSSIDRVAFAGEHNDEGFIYIINRDGSGSLNGIAFEKEVEYTTTDGMVIYCKLHGYSASQNFYKDQALTEVIKDFDDLTTLDSVYGKWSIEYTRTNI